jgi:tetratricopeptide (TPR) repeat protein
MVRRSIKIQFRPTITGWTAPGFFAIVRPDEPRGDIFPPFITFMGEGPGNRRDSGRKEPVQVSVPGWSSARFGKNDFDNLDFPGYKKCDSIMIIKKRPASILPKGILAAILLLSAIQPFASGQTTDPFYHKWLESGESSYFAHDYAQAVESLEIAIFGLAREKDLLARGDVFLALCRTALGQNDPAADALAAAAEIVGWDGLRTMDLRFEARKELDKLLANRAPSSAATPAKSVSEKKKTEEAAPPVEILPTPKPKRTDETPPKTQPETPPVTPPVIRPDTGAAAIGDLRRAIEAEPRNSGPYYDLALIYRHNRDYRNARETLERLVGQSPAEIRAYLEIGRVEYLSGDTKSAVKALEKFRSLTANVPVEEKFRDEGQALLLLCAAAKGDQKKVARLLKEAEDLFRPERFEKLTLDPADLERLRTLRRPPSK